jgi:hypothetical protein
MLERSLQRNSFGHVADCRSHQQRPSGTGRRQRNLDRELGAVGSQREQLEPCPHRTRLRFVDERDAARDVFGAEAFRQQDLDRMTYELGCRYPNRASVWRLIVTMQPSSSTTIVASGVDWKSCTKSACIITW